MLRIHTSTSAASAKSYFSSADYYSEGQELIGQWRGEGAKLLGLSGEIKQQDWDALCDNRDPRSGDSLTVRRKDNRRIGWDISFHAPKSVSLMYGLSGDERVLDAFRDAVQSTMRDIETDVQVRVRTSGKNEDRITGNLAWGEYVHFTSRPVDGVPDPQLHAHCFAFNSTFDSHENRWKAAQIGDIKRDAPYYEALFHARLARGISELGLRVERTRTGWEIAGLNRSTLERFSRRTREIEELAKRKGITDPKEKAELGAKTRRGKVTELPMDQLRALWRERLNGDEWADLGRQAFAIGRDVIPENPKVRNEAVWRAAEHCFERSAVVPERRLLAEAMKRAIGTASPESVTADVASLQLINREVNGRRLVTTREVLAEEQHMLDFARKGRGSCRPLGSSTHVVSNTDLSEGQRRAVRHILTSKDKIILIRGKAGTGKTTMLKEAVAGIEAGGKRVFTFAPSAAASRGVLRSEGFSDADTVARLLADPKLQEQTGGNVILVDEAGLLGSKVTKQLFDVAEKYSARLILAGDTSQHGSIERGGLLRLLEREAGLIPAELKDILRQKAEYKQAVRALSQGEVVRGFRTLDALGWIKEIADQERYKVLADAYLDRIRQPGTTLVVCPTHRESHVITHHIRSALQLDGRLSTDEHEFTILRPVHTTQAQRADRLSYLDGDVLIYHQNARGHRKGERLLVGRDPIPFDQADRFTVYRPDWLRLAAGDRIRITKNQTTEEGKRLNNGDLFTVTKFTDTGDLVLDSGAVVARDQGFIDLGYAVTSHNSQGRTVDHVIVGQSSASFPASSREQFYVSVSRGKRSVIVYTDSKSDLLEAVKQHDDRLTATDLVTGRDSRAHVAQLRQAPRRPDCAMPSHPARIHPTPEREFAHER